MTKAIYFNLILQKIKRLDDELAASQKHIEKQNEMIRMLEQSGVDSNANLHEELAVRIALD